VADVISSGALPVVRLAEVFRQAAQSRIIAMHTASTRA
jgi:exodeoxyribonuclease V alpha subunit